MLCVISLVRMLEEVVMERFFQHLEEVNQGLRSIENSKSTLVKEIARTQKGSDEYKILSLEIEALSELTQRIRRFLEIK